MSFITLQRTNPNAVTKRLDRLNQIFSSNLMIETAEKQMDIIYEQMYKVTPVRTGYLRSTIGVSSGSDFAQIAVTARYAAYVDQGARGRRANPFFSNTIAGLSVELIIVMRNLFTQAR